MKRIRPRPPVSYVTRRRLGGILPIAIYHYNDGWQVILHYVWSSYPKGDLRRTW